MSFTYGFSIAAVEPPGAVKSGYIAIAFILPYAVRLSHQMFKKYKKRGVVTYMQQNNLKMCLKSTDSATDTFEVAKAYGGGSSPSSSSFIIRMDEYNQWLSVNSS
ncbi:hypothetical protein VitviT2T_013807 [Vitis vinifera]|uniref:Uncharacterized protein n=1 Tax=Vitis vinifera TaxID=29760 RepID=A0ABY9CKJ8_VITVI|nr:hypothetical protein VitviT2T_013807 [Vitis vinifera]